MVRPRANGRGDSTYSARTLASSGSWAESWAVYLGIEAASCQSACLRGPNRNDPSRGVVGFNGSVERLLSLWP